MVFFSKPDRSDTKKSGGQRAGSGAPSGRAASSSKKPALSKQQLLARAAKEGHDNTRLLQKALAPANPPAQHGAGAVHTLPPQPSAMAAHNPLHQLAARVDSEAGNRSSSIEEQQRRSHAAHVPRHMLSSLGELLGRPPAPELPPTQALPPAEPAPPARWAPEQQANSAEQVHKHRQRQPPPQQPAAAASGPTNFMARNSERLGGQGVASLLGGADSALTAASRHGGSTGYMSALAALKPGLTDDQKAKAAAQREQLKRDLEEQMRAKAEAEARRKRQLQEQEEREEAALRAYYAQQAAVEGGEQQAAGGSGAKGGGGGGDGSSTARERAHSELGSGGATVVMVPPRHRGGGGGGRSSMEGGTSLPAVGTRSLGSSMDVVPQQQFACTSPVPAALPPLLVPPQLPGGYNPYLAMHQLALAGQVPLAGFSPFVLPGLAPVMAAAPALGAANDSGAVQLTGLLKELQTEQARLREQFAQQSSTVSQLQTDIILAHRERDTARQQLERVQQLLSANCTGSPAGGAAPSVPCYGSPGLNLDALAVSTVLPPSAASIPGQYVQQQAVAAGQRGSRIPGPQSAAKTQQRPGMGAPTSSRKAGAGSMTRAKPGKPGSRGWV